MANEKFFKNPNRNKNTKPVEKYQPEYKRLDVEPITYPASEEEFIKEKKQAKAKEEPQISLMTAVKKGLISKEEAEKILQKQERISRKLPEISDDQPEWTKDTVLEKEVFDTAIKESEVTLPDEEPTDEKPTDEEFSFNNIGCGEYILIQNNDVIAFGNKQTISQVMLEALDKSEVDIDDFVLLKKCPIKIGLFIDE